MKVLVSAYACETGRGSEGEIGWRIVHELAKQHDVTVITRANLREVHEKAFESTPMPPRLRFEYLDLPWIFRFYKRGKRFFLLYYYLWQIGVALRARRIMRRQDFDVLHHLTGGMDWMPSGLAFCRRPLVWGPVGSENTHPAISRYLNPTSKIRDSIRTSIRALLRTFEPLTRYTGRSAKIILSHTPETMPRRYQDRLHAFTQTGIADLPSLAKPKSDLSRCDRLRILYAGELKDWKGAGLALEGALRAFESGLEADLRVVGDGPMANEMRSVAKAHCKGGQVKLLGHMSMQELIVELHAADVFLYPSFHHGLATVVLQAMLTALPIVCVGGDATGRTVGCRAGITVPLTSRVHPTVGIAEALIALANNENQRQELARAARNIALEEFSYEALSSRISKIYQNLSNRS